MGTGLKYKGGSLFYHSLEDNAENLKSKFHFNDNTGYFGTRGQSGTASIRNIASVDPLKTAKVFYDKAAYGGKEKILPNEKGVQTRLKDGTIVTFRHTSSSDGSPAINLNISSIDSNSGKIKSQKIHFIREDPK